MVIFTVFALCPFWKQLLYFFRAHKKIHPPIPILKLEMRGWILEFYLIILNKTYSNTPMTRCITATSSCIEKII